MTNQKMVEKTEKKYITIFSKDLASILMLNGFTLKNVRKNRDNQNFHVFYFYDCPEIKYWIDLFKKGLVDFEVKVLEDIKMAV